MKRRWFVISGVLLLLTALLGGLWWWHAGRVLEQVVAFLPPVPDLDAAPPVLRERITGADARARRRAGAQTALAELARAYHANGFLDEATQCYRGLLQLEPDNPRWPHLLASILSGYGDIEPALALWQKVRQLDPAYLPAWLRSGDSMLKINRRGEAAQAYEGVLRLERDNPYALLGLARLDLEAGRLDSARARLEQVVNRTNYTLGYDLIVSLYERVGLPQRATAIRAMAKASGAYRDPPDPWLDALLDDCLEPYRLSLAAGTIARNGDAATALALLRRAAEAAPQDVSVRFQLGSLLEQQGQLPAAQEQYEQCTILAPSFADGWSSLSGLLGQMGQAVAAQRALAEGLKNCPDSPGLHLMLARSHRQAGRIGEAMLEYQHSIRLRPNEADASIELGTFLVSLGRQDEAVREFNRALAAEPGNPMALGILTYNAITRGTESEARAWLTRVREQPRIESDQVNRLLAEYQKRFGRAP